MLKVINRLPEAAPAISLLFVLTVVVLAGTPGAAAVTASGDDLLLDRFKVDRSTNLRSGLSQEEIDLLARLVAAEARGESYEGQVAVAAVVLNRIESPLFPSTVKEIVYQPRQFQPVDDGSINIAPTEESYRAVRDALRGRDPSQGALFFFNPAKANSPYLWARPLTVWIGGHRFSR